MVNGGNIYGRRWNRLWQKSGNIYGKKVEKVLTNYTICDKMNKKEAIAIHITEKTRIVQSNYLIENRPLLNKDETRLFLTIIGAINKDDSSFELLRIPVKDFAGLWGIDSKNAYEQIKVALRGLRKKEFFIEGENPQTGKERFITTSSVAWAAYEKGEGFATVEISRQFRPYLLELKEKYTTYILQNIMNLSSVNAIRNYEILKQYQTVGQRKVTFTEYKRMLQIEDKYPRNVDLKRYVVEPSVEEINEKTDIFVTYEFGGRGERAYVIFTIKSKNTQKLIEGAASQNKENSSSGSSKFIPEGEELQYYQEVEQFRDALTDPNSLSHEQLDVCVTMSQSSEWYKSLPSHISSEEKNAILKDYIKQQDKHSRANYKESFYGYFRRSCQNNWAEVPEWSKIKEGYQSSFDVEDFFQAAVARGYKEYGHTFDEQTKG